MVLFILISTTLIDSHLNSLRKARDSAGKVVSDSGGLHYNL